MDIGIQKITQALKESRSSATKGRLAVFNYLAAHGPMSVGSLAHHLSGEVDRATVYRTIELYEKLGIVNRIWQGFRHQVELSEIFTPHHHHALCQHCGKTIDISSQELEIALAGLAKKHNFLTLNHSVELSGYCSDCQ